MTAQTVTHQHVSGSVGGPGDNDAECECGATFAGFDTHREAMAALHEHIEATATPDPWAVLAAELTNIATDLAALAGSGLPAPRHIGLDMLTGDTVGKDGDDETVVRVTDAVGRVLLDREGEPKKMSDGSYHYQARGTRGPFHITLFNEVSVTWVERRKHATELVAMREQLATAEADAKRLRERLAERDEAELLSLQEEAAARRAEYAPEGRTTAVAEAKPDTYGQALSNHGGYGAPGTPALHDQALAEEAKRFPQDGPVLVVSHGPVKPPYGSPERAAYDEANQT